MVGYHWEDVFLADVMLVKVVQDAGSRKPVRGKER